MDKKIVCINQYPLNPRTKRLSYVEAFQSTGITFEYWDTTEYFGLSDSRVDCQESAEYVRKYSTLNEIKEALSTFDTEHSIFFIGIPEKSEYIKFFRLLADYKCRVIRVNPCANTLQIQKTIGDLISFFCSPKKILAYLDRKNFGLYCKVHNISYYDIFSSSVHSNRTRSINHPDYDDYHYVLKDNGGKVADGRYAVFYDSYFPLHPDFKYIHKLKMDVDYSHYLASMNHFFDWVEKKYDLEVIIAAHPSSNYGKDDFNGRKIIKWHTCDLTINAQLVINQSSNSTSFAVLANKPIIFITCDDLEKCRYMSRYVTTLSDYLGKSKINIDQEDYDNIEITQIEEGLRQKYIYSFLTDRTTENKTNDEIFADYVKSQIN